MTRKTRCMTFNGEMTICGREDDGEAMLGPFEFDSDKRPREICPNCFAQHRRMTRYNFRHEDEL